MKSTKNNSLVENRTQDFLVAYQYTKDDEVHSVQNNSREETIAAVYLLFDWIIFKTVT